MKQDPLLFLLLFCSGNSYPFCSQGREQDHVPHYEPWLPWQGKYGGAQGLVLHVGPDQILDGKRELGRSCSIQAPGWTWGTWPRTNDLHTLRHLCSSLCTFGGLRNILELPEPRIWKNILYDWVETDHCFQIISSKRRHVSLLFLLNIKLLNYSYLVVRCVLSTQAFYLRQCWGKMQINGTTVTKQTLLDGSSIANQFLSPKIVGIYSWQKHTKWQCFDSSFLGKVFFLKNVCLLIVCVKDGKITL